MRVSLPPLLALLAWLVPAPSLAQDGVAAADVEDVEGRDPDQVQAFDETSDRFTARMREFEDDTKAFIDARERQERSKLSDGYEALISTLDDLERNQRALSIDRFEEFLVDHPDAAYASHVRFRLAELYYEQASEDWLEATGLYYERIEEAGDDLLLLEDLGEEPKVDLARPIELYSRIIEDNEHLPPEQRYEYLDGAYYMLGFCYRDPSSAQQDELVARDTFQELIRVTPDSQLADAAHLFLGMHHFDENRWDDAIAEYRSVFDKGEEGKWYVEAMYQLAWAHYKIDEYDVALQLFVELLDHSERTFLESGKESDFRPDAVKYMAISFVDLADDDPDKGPVTVGRDFFSSYEPRDYEWDVYVELGEVLTHYQRFEEAVEAYRYLQEDERWLSKPENPQFQMKVVRLLASGAYGDVAAAAMARLELTERYNDRSQWWQDNRNNPEALAVARGFIEGSLADVAIEYRLKADTLAAEVGEDAPDAQAAYTLAASKFREYLDKFPISDDYYQMQWYLADTLYKAKDYSGAEAEYEGLIKSADYHEYLDGALFLLMRARQQRVVDRFASFDVLPEDAEVERTYTTEAGREIEVYRLPDDYRTFIEAADAVLAHSFARPEGPDQPDYQASVDDNRAALMYIPGQVLFRHQRFDEARPRLLQVIERMRQTDEAAYAAGLLVDSYQMEGDLAKVRLYTNEFARNPPGASAEIIAERAEQFRSLEEGAAFKQAFAYVEEAKELEARGAVEEAWPLRQQAAEALLVFIEEFPESEHVPLGLYNAANNYQIVGKAERANQLFEEYVNRYPEDERSKALYMRIAQNYESTFELDKAIDYYERLVRLDADYVDSPIALYNAAFLRIGIGDHLGAARAFEKYATTEPFRQQEDAEDVFFQAGEQYEQVGSSQALKFYERYLRRYGTSNPDHALEAMYRVAKIHEDNGATRSYDRQMDRILQTFDQLVDAGQEVGWSGRHYAAQSAFRKVQDAYDDFVDDELYPMLRRNEARNLKLLQETKAAELEEFEATAKVIITRYQDFEYSSASLFLIGAAYIHYADLGFGLTCPEDYRDEECEIYEEILWDSVYPIFENVQTKGMDRLAALVERARAEKTHTEWVTNAQVLLNERDPFNWPAEKYEIEGGTDSTIHPEVVPMRSDAREEGT